jgi:hypothetical protein
MSTNNQIIQAIAVDIAYGGDSATRITRILTVDRGTGGFVIIGENANDDSGLSVSTAGDVNGDSLDDLIVGAWGADPGSKDQAGKSYVIFGKKDSTAIELSAIASGNHLSHRR